MDELIHMATDPELLNADKEGISFWGAVHAWRALGELKAAEAIAPLLDLCEQYEELDLLFDQEFPKVFTLMGASAISGLKGYIFDDSRGEISHSYALSCVEAISVTHRKECLEIYCELLRQAD